MKNIYWKGKIYESLKDYEVDKFNLLWNDDRNKDRWVDEFLKGIPVSGPHSFKDGVVVVEGVDYKVRGRVARTDGTRDSSKDYATPIK